MQNAIIIAGLPEEYIAAVALFREYAEYINIDLSFQHFDDELASLEQVYSFPAGGICLSRSGNSYTGCVGLRKAKIAEGQVAELKRMYIQPDQRGKGTGKRLLEAAIALAIRCGYKKIVLDTLSHMETAIHLYSAYGFYEILPYYHNPIPSAVFFEKRL